MAMNSREENMEPETTDRRVYDETRARDKFGGANLGAACFGWLVAVGVTAVLTGVLTVVYMILVADHINVRFDTAEGPVIAEATVAAPREVAVARELRLELEPQLVVVRRLQHEGYPVDVAPNPLRSEREASRLAIASPSIPAPITPLPDLAARPTASRKPTRRWP